MKFDLENQLKAITLIRRYMVKLIKENFEKSIVDHFKFDIYFADNDATQSKLYEIEQYEDNNIKNAMKFFNALFKFRGRLLALNSDNLVKQFSTIPKMKKIAAELIELVDEESFQEFIQIMSHIYDNGKNRLPEFLGEVLPFLDKFRQQELLLNDKDLTSRRRAITGNISLDRILYHMDYLYGKYQALSFLKSIDTLPLTYQTTLLYTLAREFYNDLGKEAVTSAKTLLLTTRDLVTSIDELEEKTGLNQGALFKRIGPPLSSFTTFATIQHNMWRAQTEDEISDFRGHREKNRVRRMRYLDLQIGSIQSQLEKAKQLKLFIETKLNPIRIEKKTLTTKKEKHFSLTIEEWGFVNRHCNMPYSNFALNLELEDTEKHSIEQLTAGHDVNINQRELVIAIQRRLEPKIAYLKRTYEINIDIYQRAASRFYKPIWVKLFGSERPDGSLLKFKKSPNPVPKDYSYAKRFDTIMAMRSISQEQIRSAPSLEPLGEPKSNNPHPKPQEFPKI